MLTWGSLLNINNLLFCRLRRKTTKLLGAVTTVSMFCSPRSPCAAPPRSPTNRVNRRPNHSERYRYLGWKNSSVEDPTVSVLSTISYFIYRPVSSTFSVSSTCTSSEAHLPLRPSSQHLPTHHPINSQSPQSCRSKFPKPTTSWTFSA